MTAIHDPKKHPRDADGQFRTVPKGEVSDGFDLDEGASDPELGQRLDATGPLEYFTEVRAVTDANGRRSFQWSIPMSVDNPDEVVGGREALESFIVRRYGSGYYDHDSGQIVVTTPSRNPSFSAQTDAKRQASDPDSDPFKMRLDHVQVSDDRHANAAWERHTQDLHTASGHIEDAVFARFPAGRGHSEADMDQLTGEYHQFLRTQEMGWTANRAMAKGYLGVRLDGKGTSHYGLDRSDVDFIHSQPPIQASGNTFVYADAN